MKTSDAWEKKAVVAAGGQHGFPPGIAQRKHALFEHQSKSVEKLHAWWSSSERAGVLCLPTGAGKTITALEFIVCDVLSSGGRVLWLTDRVELLEQAMATALSLGHRRAGGIVVGRCQGKLKADVVVDVLVASTSTLRGPDVIPQLLAVQKDIDLVVYDECHRAVAPTRMKLLQGLQAVLPRMKLLGLSASPTRADVLGEQSLWRLFGSIIDQVPAVELIAQRILATPTLIKKHTGRAYAIDELLSEDAYDAFCDDEDGEELPAAVVQKIAADEQRNKLALRYFLDRADDWGQTIIFAATVDQAEFFRDELQEAGISTAWVHSKGMSYGERRSELEKFRQGKAKVIVNVTVLTEGTDLPLVASVFIVRVTRSQVLFQQMVGRGMRGPEVRGTPGCNVVAFVDDFSGLEKTMAGSWDERSVWANMGFDETLIVEDGKHATAPAPAETEGERLAREKRDATKVALRELLRDANILLLGGSTRDLMFLGWWAARGTKRAILPLFSGDDEVHRWAVQVAKLVACDASLPPVPPSSTLSHALMSAFARAVAQSGQPPVRHGAEALETELPRVQRVLESMLSASEYRADAVKEASHRMQQWAVRQRRRLEKMARESGTSAASSGADFWRSDSDRMQCERDIRMLHSLTRTPERELWERFTGKVWHGVLRMKVEERAREFVAKIKG